MRHARAAAWTVPGRDGERPLTPEGLTEAREVADALVARGWAPDHVVASHATRVRETWAAMAATFPDVSAEHTRDLYLRGTDAAIDVLITLPTAHRTVLVIGHNPDHEALVQRLSGAVVRMHTANAALLVGGGATWADALARDGQWQCVELVSPGG